MTRKNVLTAHAVVLFTFAAGFFFIPKQLIAFYGGNLDPLGVVIARFLGSVQFGNVYLGWVFRNLDYSKEVRNFTIAQTFLWSVGAVIAMFATLNGVLNFMGWGTVVICALLGLGFAYVTYWNPET